MPLRIISLLSILFAAASYAQISVEPVAPTTATPIRLLLAGVAADGCSLPVNEPRITITAGAIEVRYVNLGGGACTSATMVWTREVDLGTLAAGRYNVTLVLPRASRQGDYVGGRAEIVVADAGPARIEPSGTPFDAPGEIAIAWPFDRLIELTAPGPVEVTFGSDPPVTGRVEHYGVFRSALFVRPRARTRPEVVDVKLGTGPSAIVMRNAFTFYDPAAGLNARVFEPILIPIVFNGPGAFGTQWRTDVTLHRRDAGVSSWRIPLVSFRPIHSQPLDAQTLQPDLVGERPRGFVHHVARSGADRLQFAVTVRETSRGIAASRVPVVRESDLRSDFTLLDVPVTSRVRSKLRVYAHEPIQALVANFIGSGIPWPQYFQLTSRASIDEPYYAEIDLGPVLERLRTVGALAGREFIRVELSVLPGNIPQPFWAWITVTDNETQAVTFITDER